MSTATRSVYEWNALPWKRIQRQVFKLQKQIYRASQRGEVKTVHRLQRLLLRSWAAKCLAVRRVTQDNQGKKTAGIDGVKNLRPQSRLALASSLNLATPARPVRRVWIPKPRTTERRPLGIPPMQDRARQTLARFALEPEWEAHFEPNSFGFRPGRSCHDAIQAVFNAVRHKPKFVLDADIAACFDRINHTALVHKLHTFPTLRRAIHGWLTAGVMDGTELFPTTAGTPQGGALSPLLANIALHGLETSIRAAFPSKQHGKHACKPLVIRYADDFVAVHEDQAVVEQVQHLAAQWLAGMGLELKPSKTKITHTLHPHHGHVGFDFLGFTVRQFAVGQTHASATRYGQALVFKTIIKPSPEAQKRHLAHLAEAIHRQRQAPQQALITTLNRMLVGWTTYYSTQVSKAVFARLDHLLYRKLKRWAERRHPTKSHTWVRHHYWHPRGQRQWVFGPQTGTALALHAETSIRRHIKVKGSASLYDGDVVYWASRLGRHPELSRRKAILLKRQGGQCAWCGLAFLTVDEVIEADHVVPQVLGGHDRLANRQLLHRHCHDAKTTTDGSNRRQSGRYP
jgi:RNA-directed DNA polymerase